MGRRALSMPLLSCLGCAAATMMSTTTTSAVPPSMARTCERARANITSLELYTQRSGARGCKFKLTSTTSYSTATTSALWLGAYVRESLIIIIIIFVHCAMYLFVHVVQVYTTHMPTTQIEAHACALTCATRVNMIAILQLALT